MPPYHPPGHAQADFGEAVIEMGSFRLKAHVFFMILPHSGAWFVGGSLMADLNALRPLPAVPLRN